MTSKRTDPRFPDDAELRILVNQGATVAELIGRFNVSKSYVYRRLKYLGAERTVTRTANAAPIRKTSVNTPDGPVSLPWISIQQSRNGSFSGSDLV